MGSPNLRRLKVQDYILFLEPSSVILFFFFLIESWILLVPSNFLVPCTLDLACALSLDSFLCLVPCTLYLVPCTLVVP
jgi:hypothetical protein